MFRSKVVLSLIFIILISGRSYGESNFPQFELKQMKVEIPLGLLRVVEDPINTIDDKLVYYITGQEFKKKKDGMLPKGIEVPTDRSTPYHTMAELMESFRKGDIDLFAGKLKLQTRDVSNLSSQHPMCRASSMKVHLYKLSFDKPNKHDRIMCVKSLDHMMYNGCDLAGIWFKIEATTNPKYTSYPNIKRLDDEFINKFIEQYNKK